MIICVIETISSDKDVDDKQLSGNLTKIDKDSIYYYQFF